jgi:hypothetical protein
MSSPKQKPATATGASIGEPRVKTFSTVKIGATTLKVYTYDTVASNLDAMGHLLTNFPAYKTAEMGNVGVAFLYGFNNTNGADIFLFRNPSDQNTMIDSLTIEDGISLPRGKGVAREREILNLAKEARLRRSMLANQRGYLNKPALQVPTLEFLRTT